MANKEVPLLYDEYRLNALERALEENGSSVEMALKNTLDSLYRRFVPHAERAEIESRIQQEEAVAQVSPNNTVGVFHLHNADGDIIFSSKYVKGLFQFAKLYGEYMQFDVNQYSIDSVVGYFGESRILDPELFSMVCNTFRSSENICIIADIDFERGNISALEKGMDTWHTYSLDDVLSAVRASATQAERHLKSQQNPSQRMQVRRYRCRRPVRPKFALCRLFPARSGKESRRAFEPNLGECRANRKERKWRKFMNIERIQLDFNKRKYDALEQSFSRMSQGSVITELEKYLDFLYEKNVPVSEREEIETNSCQEHLAYRAMIAPGKKFSVITLNNADGRISFSSEGLLTFLDIANVYREKVRDWVDITNLETIRTFFGENDLLDPLSFLLFVKRLEYNPSVTMLADFDFEKDTIRVLKSGNTEWSAYRLKDVASAAFLAYQKPELHLSERRKLFDEYLSDREIPNQK